MIKTEQELKAMTLEELDAHYDEMIEKLVLLPEYYDLVRHEKFLLRLFVSIQSVNSEIPNNH